MGATALHYACYHGELDVVAYLCDVARAELQPRDAEGHTPSDWAIEGRRPDVASFVHLRVRQPSSPYTPASAEPTYPVFEPSSAVKSLKFVSSPFGDFEDAPLSSTSPMPPAIESPAATRKCTVRRSSPMTRASTAYKIRPRIANPEDALLVEAWAHKHNAVTGIEDFYADVLRDLATKRGDSVPQKRLDPHELASLTKSLPPELRDDDVLGEALVEFVRARIREENRVDELNASYSNLVSEVSFDKNQSVYSAEMREMRSKMFSALDERDATARQLTLVTFRLEELAKEIAEVRREARPLTRREIERDVPGAVRRMTESLRK